MGVTLSVPLAPFQRLNVSGESITIDVDAKKIVIPTDNQLLLPGNNQWTESPNTCNLVETPCGGLKNSIVQDKAPGALSIEGDGCYLQTLDGNYTGKTIGAGKLSETTSIKDSGTTGIALATADGVAIKMMDGNLILLRPPSCIVDDFKVINISNVAATYTITIQCTDSITSIELYNPDAERTETVTFTKVGDSYTFSKPLSPNSSEKFQLTIKYQSLAHTTEFTNDANRNTGLQNMSKSFIVIIPKTGTDLDILSFTERPKSISYTQDADGTISQVTIFPGNGSINHSRITHPNHSKISGTGTLPDILNVDIEGSVTKFLQSHGMKTDFPVDATITTWIVPAITDEKILPMSTISDDYLGDEINLRISPGEYGYASFVIESDKDINLNVVVSDLVYGEYTISKNNLDVKSVKCWFQGNYSNDDIFLQGRYPTPELLLHDDSLIAIDETVYMKKDITNLNGKNYLKIPSRDYVDISIDTPQKTDYDIIPISDRPIHDATTLQPVNIHATHLKQFFITPHILPNTAGGTYQGKILLTCGGHTLKTLNITIQVLPIILSPPNIEYSIYYHGIINNTGSISSIYKTVEQYTAEMQNMLEHGITNPNFDSWVSYSVLIQELAIRQQVGIDNTNLYTEQNFVLSNINQYKTDLAQYGVVNIYQYGPDEHAIGRNHVTDVHNAGGKYFNSQSVALASDVADILDLAISAHAPSQSLAALYHDPIGKYDGKPHRIFSYFNPLSAPECPLTTRRNYGLLMWQVDYDGVMNFAYQWGFGDIWNDFNYYQRGSCYTYPTSNGVIDTLKYEGLRAAVNDMRYLATLQAAITEANDRGVVTTEIDSWLATLKTTDLSNADLDEIRSQIIDYILFLEHTKNYAAVLMKNGKAILFKDGNQLFLEG